ncbi:MAG: hypothetical protein IIB78_07290, partial [Proteobacteria bacterium]|nr:hypothetical protein [Pseudomonadota bacterium]
ISRQPAAGLAAITERLPELSFFCPAFNEEENLEPVVHAVYPVLKLVADDFEFIIVNNGSTTSAR